MANHRKMMESDKSQILVMDSLKFVTMHPRIASSLAEQQLEEHSAVRTLRRGAPSISFAGKRANN